MERLFYGGSSSLFINYEEVLVVDFDNLASPSTTTAVSRVAGFYGQLGYRQQLSKAISIAPWIGPGYTLPPNYITAVEAYVQPGFVLGFGVDVSYTQ